MKRDYPVQQCDVCEAPPRQKLPVGWVHQIYKPTPLSTREYVMTHLPTCPMVHEGGDQQ